ncbi:MAG: putative toxin-antitoxin system toxin component, PIN family [Desulfobaccales bacterium]
MIRVVLDTNVLVSALLTPGNPPAKILEMALEGHLRIIISPAIIREIGLVFRHPRLKKTMERHHLSSQEVEEAIFKILKVATITPGEALTQGVSRDPADDQVLWCAVEGRADFIISGDQDLTVLESYEGIRILEPAVFLRLVAQT